MDVQHADLPAITVLLVIGEVAKDLHAVDVGRGREFFRLGFFAGRRWRADPDRPGDARCSARVDRPVGQDGPEAVLNHGSDEQPLRMLGVLVGRDQRFGQQVLPKGRHRDKEGPVRAQRNHVLPPVGLFHGPEVFVGSLVEIFQRPVPVVAGPDPFGVAVVQGREKFLQDRKDSDHRRFSLQNIVDAVLRVGHRIEQWENGNRLHEVLREGRGRTGHCFFFFSFFFSFFCVGSRFINGALSRRIPEPILGSGGFRVGGFEMVAHHDDLHHKGECHKCHDRPKQGVNAGDALASSARRRVAHFLFLLCCAVLGSIVVLCFCSFFSFRFVSFRFVRFFAAVQSPRYKSNEQFVRYYR
mmetsp:Transcript_3911/g.11085  ORF Transcript_3911/g.11085 Transcript_3911/m.11085 type:complete len:355 (-) Transcript_3911:129-1193(-)